MEHTRLGSLSQRGRVYQLGRHRLMCGDATNPEEVAQLMDGARADMLFSDPPYNVGYVGRTKRRAVIRNDALQADKFAALLTSAFTRMADVAHPGAPIYVCHPDRHRNAFTAALEASGWYIAQTIIWVKHHFVLGRSDYHWRHEPIAYGWKPGAPHRWYSDRKQTTVWHFDRPMRNLQHPTMKPVALVAHALERSSRLGDVVLDTFGGSGSTLIAAEATGRTAYVMELDPTYCDVIRQRYAHDRIRL